MSTSPRLLVLAVPLAVGSGCESRTVQVVEVAGVEIRPPNPTVLAGDSLLLSARLEGPAGEPLTGRTVVWSGGDPLLATVSADGMLRGVSPGEAVVRATAEGVSDETTVSVLPAPTLELSAQRVALTAVEGRLSEARSVDVRNGGAGDVSGLSVDIVELSPDTAAWLSVGLNRTSTPARVAVQASAERLGAGAYQATVRVGSPVHGGLEATFGVDLTVVEAEPRIVLGTGSVGFSALQGGQASAVQTVAVTNGGGGTLAGLSATVEYAAGEPGGWLSASLDGASAPATLSLQATPGALAAGTYRADVVVASPAAEAAVGLQVTFTVAAVSTGRAGGGREP